MGQHRIMLLLFLLSGMNGRASQPICDKAALQLRRIDQEILLFQAKNQRRLPEESELTVLLQKTRLIATHDPWGRPWYYRNQGEDYDLRSLGADGRLNSEDDLRRDQDYAWMSCDAEHFSSGCW